MDCALAFAGPLASPHYLTPAQAVRVEEGATLPRLPDHNLNGVAYLFRTEEEARKRVRSGGSGFFVGRPIPHSERVFGSPRYLPFLVSNRHVVIEGSACVAAVNRRDGDPPDIWDLDQNDWVPHPKGDDVAAICVHGYMSNIAHRIAFIQERMLVTPEMLGELHIGLGDDVFMVGRFINLQGSIENEPAVRFGNISVGYTLIPVAGPGGIVRKQESFAVEMRSRTGFSGSPVCVVRTAGNTLDNVPEGAEHFWRLLGVNWGYILDEHGENTWLNGVVPAWKVSEVLNAPRLQAIVDKHAALLEHMPDYDPGELPGLLKMIEDDRA